MSDDEDYMSCSFLNVENDIRPGLTHSKGVKRKYDIEKKRVESNKLYKMKSLKELEEENRNAGLENAISPDNKGFALLQKMGYKPGMKLGQRKEDSNVGLSEPIKIKLKSGRGGLGREEEILNKIKLREQQRTKIKVWKEKETERLTEEFRERMRNKVLYKSLMVDLAKSQKVCQQLDTQNNVDEPLRPWFWYTYENKDEDEDNEEEDYETESLDIEEQLNFILDYLRSKYFYCLWCGIKYDDEDDISSNCPGIEKSDHDES